MFGFTWAQDAPGKADGERPPWILPTLTVQGQETANVRPVTTYESPISNLDFDPRVDMQSRNMAEAQGDVSIRGGTFENSGVQVGSATLLDPQTGHYATELPIAPEMLGEPRVYTGAENALRGFNSSVGTVGYSWSKMTQGGSATVGGGDHDLNFQRLHNALVGQVGDSADWSWGVEIESSRSESDGTIAFGDHDFDRTTGRIQLVGPNSQTDFFAGYQEKFFGLAGMYTANVSNHETEDLQTRLLYLNHLQKYKENSNWELSLFHRRHTDHFVLRRESPTDYLADHETEVNALAFTGRHVINDRLSINHSTQFTADEIVTSALWGGTKIRGYDQGNFTSRDYIKVTLLPEYRREIDDRKSIVFKAGASMDDTNRDSSKVSPIAEISWLKSDGPGSEQRTYLSYAQTTQVLGYGAIGGSEGGGLFRSNHDLPRSTSQNFEIGHKIKREKWSLDGAIFYRRDKDLADWTFENDANGTHDHRDANPVDIDTFGIEFIASRQWSQFETIASYARLNKNEDYKDSAVDGSFYALNFPEHRVTLGLIWNPSDLFEIRMDNEWRQQREQRKIRTGPDQSTYSHLAASYYPSQIDDLEIFIAFDKPWDEDFQDIPGTPGRSDQFSLGATYSW